jgi:hypothetical protein
MDRTIEATFDGQVFRPTEPVSLPPNTVVRLTVEPVSTEQPTSFLRTALSLKLDGPPDWASNLDKYLYGRRDEGDD